MRLGLRPLLRPMSAASRRPTVARAERPDTGGTRLRCFNFTCRRRTINATEMWLSMQWSVPVMMKLERTGIIMVVRGGRRRES